MNISATILYPYDSRVEQLFTAEDKQLSERAKYTVSRDSHNLKIFVEASDATALRACITTITKVLSAWEATSDHGRA